MPRADDGTPDQTQFPFMDPPPPGPRLPLTPDDAKGPLLPLRGAAQPDEIEVGPLRLRAFVRTRQALLAPIGTRTPMTAEIATHVVVGPGGLHLELAEATWRHGAWQVAVENAFESDESLRQIENRLRMPIRSLGAQRAMLYLTLAEKRRGDRPGRVHPDSLLQLRRAAGLDVLPVLRRQGDVEVGPKSAFVSADDRARNYLCASFDRRARCVPAVAFVLTHVLPLLPAPMKRAAAGGS